MTNLNEVLIEKMNYRICHDNVLSCLIYKGDALVYQHYKNNRNELQTINSCTKSILSALIGIAIDRGLIEGTQVPIYECFGDILKRDIDNRKKKITIEHLLTMTPGFYWQEYGEGQNFSPMTYNKDIINQILERPLTSNPGEVMNYNSGCSHLLSALLQKAAGMSTHEFAKINLFNPIGIRDTEWHSKDCVDKGSDGLRITSEDMIKIGKVFLDKGKFEGKQIITEKWISDSTTGRYLTYKNIGHYGYHWWSSTHQFSDYEVSFYFALGFGGQLMAIVPEHQLVVVFTSNKYNDSLRPLHYFKRYILPSIKMNI